jgi:hypothetical protein
VWQAVWRKRNLFPDGDWGGFVIDSNDQDRHSVRYQQIHFNLCAWVRAG